jgi:hypothetical protein
MKFEVLMAVNIKTAVFWDVMPCSLVDGYHVSEESAAFISFTLKTEALYSSKTLVRIYQIT